MESRPTMPCGMKYVIYSMSSVWTAGRMHTRGGSRWDGHHSLVRMREEGMNPSASAVTDITSFRTVVGAGGPVDVEEPP